MPLHDRTDLEIIAAFAEELADLAAPVALRYFRQKLVVESKADTSPVTIADREIELAMRRMIAERQFLPDPVEPHDVAAMATWLASDDAKACTAQCFVVDGGWI